MTDDTQALKTPDFNEEDDDDTDQQSQLRRLLVLAQIPSSAPDLVAPYTSITKLNLTGCGLSELPDSFPTAFPNLSILFLSNNHFIEMPALVGQCQHLQMVAFKSNSMTSIHPDALQSQLRWLILTDNQLTQIPDTIQRCVNLQKLMLSGNDLVELPEVAMIHCRNLELMRLASNQLAEPPTKVLQQLPHLKWVALGDNPFLQNAYYEQEATMDLDVWRDLDTSDAEILGRGAGGVTRKVYDTKSQQYVAVKSFDAPSHGHVATASHHTLRRMTSDGRPEHEALVFARASAATKHHDPPTVVQVLGQTPPDHALVMEFLEDYQALADPPSLESCTRDVYDGDKSLLTLGQATTLASRLLEAQVALHAAGICHGDFYGHNILLHKDCDESRLSDFGAAFFYDSRADYAASLQVCELRAFGVLVQEVRALVVSAAATSSKDLPQETTLSPDDVDASLSSPPPPDLLEQLSTKCLDATTTTTFDPIAIWWKQQQLKRMAKSLHDELFN